MLFVGDDWAEDPHDVEIVDDTGAALARRRLSNGLDGITVLHTDRRAFARGVGPIGSWHRWRAW
jgi:hypothetical protein